jgi:hypothetical protein
VSGLNKWLADEKTKLKKKMQDKSNSNGRNGRKCHPFAGLHRLDTGEKNVTYWD